MDEGDDRSEGWLHLLMSYGGYVVLIALAAAIWRWSFSRADCVQSWKCSGNAPICQL